MPRGPRSLYSRLKLVTPESQALQIVRTLRAAGHLAYWVGGCVRDRLLGIAPKDFDVATSATPEKIVPLFPASVLIGASFGVVRFRDVEIATFRSEGDYTDGRHPDRVRYEIDPRLDAARRDFTINAIFYDPIEAEYLDFFDGRADLENRCVRAVGDASARFAEDRLRLLRAIRFAARFAFEIEAQTWSAIQNEARSILLVSAERTHDELNCMFTGPHPNRALGLLQQAGLLEALIPEAASQGFPEGKMSVPLAWAALLLGVEKPRAVLNRFRFSHADTEGALAILRSQRAIPQARELSLADFKRLVRQPNFDDHLRLSGPSEIVDWIRERWTQLTQEELKPAPLLTGADLIALGMTPGPRFRELLASAEDAQLNGRIVSREQALAWLGLA